MQRPTPKADTANKKSFIFDDPEKQKGALINIQNHINAVGKENLDFKVVMHGDELSLVLEPILCHN